MKHQITQKHSKLQLYRMCLTNRFNLKDKSEFYMEYGLHNDTYIFNKPGTAQVGAKSKAQK